jgi:hypothetical protein
MTRKKTGFLSAQALWVVQAKRSGEPNCGRSSGEIVDQRARSGGYGSVSGPECHAAVGFEFKIELGVTNSTQPVVLNRFARGRSPDRSNHSAITEIVQGVVTGRIEAFG